MWYNNNLQILYFMFLFSTDSLSICVCVFSQSCDGSGLSTTRWRRAGQTRRNFSARKWDHLCLVFTKLESCFKTRKTRRAAFFRFWKKVSRLLVNNSKEIKYFFVLLFLDYKWIPKLTAILEKLFFCTFFGVTPISS